MTDLKPKTNKNKIYRFLYENRYFLLTVLLVALFCLIPLATMATTKGHDSPFHLQRIEALAAEMKRGNFFPRIYTTLLEGNGYASPMFYGDLFLIIPAALFGWCGVSITDSFALFIALIFLFTAMSMYACTYSITKNERAAFCGSIMYGLSSYLCTDLIQRCALGESQAFIFVPVVFLGFYHIMFGEIRKWYFLPIGLAAMLRCHTLSAVMTVVMLLFLFIASANKILEKPKRIMYLFVSVLAFAVLGADFLFPSLEQMASTTFLATDGYAAKKWGSLLSRALPYWWSPFGDFNVNSPESDNAWIPNGVGLAGVVFTLIYFAFSRKNRDRLVPRLLGVSAVILFLTTKLFPWKEVQDFVGVIQFPWRFLVFPTFLIALAAAIYFGKIQTKRFSTALMTVVICFSLFSYFCSFGPYFERYYKYQQNGTKLEYSYKDNIGAAEYLPTTDEFERNSNYNSKYRNALIKNAEKIYSDGKLHASMTREDGKLIVHFSKNQKDGAYLDVPLVMYKGYTATLDDGTKLECGYGFYNRVRVILDGREEGTVTFEYTGTTVQNVSRAINVVGFFAMAVYIVISKRKEKQKTLFAVDLDGTLMDRSGEMTGSVCEKINDAINCKKCIAVATARTPATAVEKLSHLNIEFPVVVMNGSAVFDIKTKTYHNVIAMKSDRVENLKKAASGMAGAIFYTLEGQKLVAYYESSSGKYFDEFIATRENEYKTFKKVESFLNTPLENVVHFAVICQSNKVKHEYDKIKNISGINKFYSLGNDGYGLVEANELMATKTLGLEYIEKKYGFDTVIAFGNDGNDIPMMKSASISVCPANATDEVKSNSTVILEDNRTGSVAEFIKNFK